MSSTVHLTAYKPRKQRAPKPNSGRVTEIIGTGPLNGDPITPMLRQLSHSPGERWLTLVVPHHWNRQQLRASGLNPARVRLITMAKGDDGLWLTWQALANGTSDTVVALLPPLDQHARRQLEQAAGDGGCQGVFVRAQTAA